jgi:hypothetical protein
MLGARELVVDDSRRADIGMAKARILRRSPRRRSDHEGAHEAAARHPGGAAMGDEGKEFQRPPPPAAREILTAFAEKRAPTPGLFT